MKRRFLCLTAAFVLLLCSCGKEDHARQEAAPTSTTTTTNTTTITTVDKIVTTTENRGIDAPTVATQTIVTTTNASSTFGSLANTTHTNTTTSIGIDTTPSTTKTSTTIPTTSPDSTIFKATIRDTDRNPVGGVVVSVWISADVQVGSATTNSSGVALITVPKRSSYLVRLALPNGYEAESEYRFATSTVNITIRKAAVQNELDHSQAQYAVGKMMTDFSLTDTDGNVYRLSELLEKKKLVILDFWYTSCEPCKLEFPFFEAAVQTYGEDVALLAIDPIDSANTIIALRNQLNSKPETSISFPMLKDTCNLYLGFDVTSYPVTVFIDSNGRIMEIHDGAYQTQTDFLATIQKYLG